MMSVWVSGYIVTLYYSISVRLHSSLPACFFPLSFSPPPFIMSAVTSHCSCILYFFHSITFTIFYAFPFSFLLPPSPFLSFCLPFITLCTAFFLLPVLPPPLTLNLHTLFCLFLSFFSTFTNPLILHSHFGCNAGAGSWRLSPRIVGCCRGLQRPRQNLRAVCHHCVQTQPRRQRGLLEDLPTLLGLPRLPYEDHWDGVFRSQWYFYLRRNLTLWSKYSWTCVVYSFCFSLRTWRQSSSCQGKRPSTTWTETSWRRGKRTSMLTYR